MPAPHLFSIDVFSHPTETNYPTTRESPFAISSLFHLFLFVSCRPQLLPNLKLVNSPFFIVDFHLGFVLSKSPLAHFLLKPTLFNNIRFQILFSLTMATTSSGTRPAQRADRQRVSQQGLIHGGNSLTRSLNNGQNSLRSSDTKPLHFPPAPTSRRSVTPNSRSNSRDFEDDNGCFSPLSFNLLHCFS